MPFSNFSTDSEDGEGYVDGLTDAEVNHQLNVFGSLQKQKRVSDCTNRSALRRHALAGSLQNGRKSKVPYSVSSQTATTNIDIVSSLNQQTEPPHAIQEQESEDKLCATIRLDGLNLNL